MAEYEPSLASRMDFHSTFLERAPREPSRLLESEFFPFVSEGFPSDPVRVNDPDISAILFSLSFFFFFSPVKYPRLLIRKLEISGNKNIVWKYHDVVGIFSSLSLSISFSPFRHGTIIGGRSKSREKGKVKGEKKKRERERGN